jgi:hypothetical protein
VEDLPAEELYDLRADPYETNNLANDPEYQDTLRTLRSRLKSHLEETSDQGLQPDSEQIVQVFEEYGEQSFLQRKGKIEKLHQQVLQAVKAGK